MTDVHSDDANFAATLTERARTQPCSVALIEPDPGQRGRWRSITFADFEQLAMRFASGVQRYGVEPGQRVLYLLPPSIRGFAAFYALLRVRAVPVLVDPRMELRSLLACMTEPRPTALLGIPLAHALSLLAPAAFSSVRTRITDGGRWLWRGPSLADCDIEATFDHAMTSEADASIFPYTSGSTGPAKGVACTHGMLRFQAQITPEVCSWRAGMKVVMCYAPFVPYALANGLTVILPDIDFTRPAATRLDRIVIAIREHGAQCAFGSPIIWSRLVRYAEQTGVTMPTLERAVTAGAPVPVQLHNRLLPLLHPEGRLYTPYGATEAMPVTTTHSGEVAATWERSRAGYGTSVGKPLSGVTVTAIRITDEPIPEWSADLCVAVGDVGELVVGGALVSAAYPLRPDTTARAKIRAGDRVLHRTGDLGRIDADGSVWFCGRKSQRVTTASGMLPTTAIENILNEHPAIYRSAVVGVGRAGAQAAVACVELEPKVRFSRQLAEEMLRLARGTCYEGVVQHVLPHHAFPVDARHNSKIKRDVLAQWAERRLARRSSV